MQWFWIELYIYDRPRKQLVTMNFIIVLNIFNDLTSWRRLGVETIIVILLELNINKISLRSSLLDGHFSCLVRTLSESWTILSFYRLAAASLLRLRSHCNISVSGIRCESDCLFRRTHCHAISHLLYNETWWLSQASRAVRARYALHRHPHSGTVKHLVI